LEPSYSQEGQGAAYYGHDHCPGRGSKCLIRRADPGSGHETSAANVGIGEQIQFTVLAYPNETFRGNISYVAAAMDPNSRRLLVRATIPNPQGLLKPEMFASVTIFTDEGDWSPAVPVDAVIYEGDKARVWVARDDKSIELRQVTTGARNGRLLQVVSGLRLGEQVITKGSLFIDRVAAGS